MKKPNLRSIKGPNKAAKYAELMKKYRKYQSSIVKSPGGKVVKSPGGKLAVNKPVGKLAKRPGVAGKPTRKALPPSGGTSGTKTLKTKSQLQSESNKRAQASRSRRDAARMKQTRAAKGSGPTPGKAPIKGMPRNRLKEAGRSLVKKVKNINVKGAGKKISNLAAKTGVVGKVGGRALILKAGIDQAKDIKQRFSKDKTGKYRGLAKVRGLFEKKPKSTKKKGLSNIPPTKTKINKVKPTVQKGKVTEVSNKTSYKAGEKAFKEVSNNDVTPVVDKTTKSVPKRKNIEVKPKTRRERFNEKFIKTKKGKLARRGTVGARKAENREAARNRAKEMAKKRIAAKKK